MFSDWDAKLFNEASNLALQGWEKMLSNLAVVGEAKRGHRSDAGLPILKSSLYGTQALSLNILPEDVQAYVSACMNLRVNRDPHWFYIEGPEISPLETAGLKLLVSTSWLLCATRRQQTGHPVAPLSKSQRERTTLWSWLLLLFRQHLSPGPRAAMEERPLPWDTAVLGVPKMGVSHFCQGLSSPFFSSLLLVFYLPLSLLHFCPLTAINQRSVTDTGNGVGAVGSNDLSFAHIISFTHSHVAAAPTYWLPSLQQREKVPQMHFLLIQTEREVVCLTPHKIQLLCI